MQKSLVKVFVGAALVAVCATPALAADQKVIGKKLLIKNPGGAPSANNKIVFLAKDPSIAQPTGVTQDPRCTPNGSATTGSASASLTVTGSDSFSIPLICNNWTVNGAGNLFKYKDTSGASCNVLIVKDGKLVKAVCKGLQVAYDLNGAETSIDVVLRSGPANRYCSNYSTASGCSTKKDGSDGKTYLVKNCNTAPGACGASPSGAFVETASLF